MSVLITGAADFIGNHITRALLARGEMVVGVDNFSAYYEGLASLRSGSDDDLIRQAKVLFTARAPQSTGAKSWTSSGLSTVAPVRREASAIV